MNPGMFGGKMPPPKSPFKKPSAAPGKTVMPPDDGSDASTDDGKAADPHANLDELLSGSPAVADAITGLLKALCGEENAEDMGAGDAGGAPTMGGGVGGY